MLLTTAMAMLACGAPATAPQGDALREAADDLKRMPASSWPSVRYLMRPKRWDDKTWQDRQAVLAGWLNHLSRSQIRYPLGSIAVYPVGKHLLRVDVSRLKIGAAWDRMASPYEFDGVIPVAVIPTKGKGPSTMTWRAHPLEGRRLDLVDGAKLVGTYYESDGKFYLYTRIVRDGGGETRYTSTEPSDPPIPPPGITAFPPTPFAEKSHRQPSQMMFDSKADADLWNLGIEYTGSQAWLVRADWWLNQALAAQGRAVGYPELLGFGSEKEFQEIIGFDEKLFKRFAVESRDAVGLSGVTLQPRAIVRWNSAGGSYWKSIDFISPKGVEDPLEVVGEDIERRYDASEQYGRLPNGLWAMGAFDGKGKLQRAVPTEIAWNRHAKGADPAIHVGWTCVACHGKGGLRDIDMWHRRNLRAPLKGDFTEEIKRRYDPKEAEKRIYETEQQYFSDMGGMLQVDRIVYEAAIKDVSGLDGDKFALAVEAAWHEYEDARVDQKFAAAEFGMTAAEFKSRLDVVLDRSYKLYPPVRVRTKIGALANPKAAMTIRQWEEVAGEAWSLIRGVEIGAK